MESFTVYCHTNKINGKKYIGITGKGASNRWGKNGIGYRLSTFGGAIKKYGWDGFTHEILYTDLTKAQAQQYEMDLIYKYKTANRDYGYNLTYGGECEIPNEETRSKISAGNLGKIMSEESRIKMSISRKGRIISEEQRKKLSISGLGNKNGLGYKHSPERKAKMSASHIGKALSAEHRAKISSGSIGKIVSKESMQKLCSSNYVSVVQMSIDGEVIKTYPSCISAKKELDINGITACCRGRQKTAGGFKWKYAN